MVKRILLALTILAFLLTSCNFPFFDQGTDGTSANPLFPGLQAKPSPTPTITPTPQPRARVTIGEADLLNGDYDAALTEFWTARSQSTDADVIAAAQLGVGRVLLATSDYNGAVEQLIWLLTNFSDGESRNTAYYFLAKAYEGLEQYRLAADAYASYLTAQPGPLDSEIREMQADALLQAGDPAAARIIYDQAWQTAVPASRDALAIKTAQASAAAGDNEDAITRYIVIYDASSSDYIKAQANLLLGRVYLSLEQPELAYARFQDSVVRFPTYYDAYSGLVALVEADQPVSELMRGVVDYYAGQWGLAAKALDRYMILTPNYEGSAHYYKALSLYEMGEFELEIVEWDKLIRDRPTTGYPTNPYIEKATTQWSKLGDYLGSAQTLLDYVARVPDSPDAPTFLNTAAKIYEIGGYLTKASETWQRLFNEYPGHELAYPAFFESGIVAYRLGNYQDAQIVFQRLLLLGTTPNDLAAANLWTAKCLEKQGRAADAAAYYTQAAAADPTGYYSIRAQEILDGQPPFPPAINADLAIDLNAERLEAERWMRETFKLDPAANLTASSELAANPIYQRGETFWKLGMRDRARSEFETLRRELQGDAVNTFRLLTRVVEMGFYQTAALASRQVLDIAGLSQAATLTDAPKYFNHIRFGVFFRDIIVPAAVENDIDPLLLFSLIRQESLFDTSITSSAGAHGLMQITTPTGETIARDYNWPPNYQTSDLDRAMINIPMGAHYLKIWLNKYGGSVPAALASYNAGDGNNLVWIELAGGDPDLLIEVIRFDETRDYIKYIAENYAIYKSIYTHP